MLSTDYLGTQELHSFCKTTEILEDSQSQEIALDRTAVGSTLLSHQNGKVRIYTILDFVCSG
jgi:CTD small phosphatase-like protein 2